MHNKRKIQQLTIAHKNGISLDKKSSTLEDVENPLYREHKHQSLYPPKQQYKKFYQFWMEHQSCYWSVSENDPSVDRTKFARAPKELQEIVLSMVGCIMIGDSIVLDRLGCDLKNKITAVEVLAMLSDQEAREYTHKAMYSKMLDVSSNSSFYRSEFFKNTRMARFGKIARKYASNDIRIQVYFIMLCENILFAPMFQTICYLATLGYAPKLCDSNLLVMRDEFLHYENARHLLASFVHKIDIDFANEILNEFHSNINILIRELMGTYDDGVLNADNMEKHLNHVVHSFRIENNLYESIDLLMDNHAKYETSPAFGYMSLPKCEIRNNLMESNSTIYMVLGNNETIDMNFEF